MLFILSIIRSLFGVVAFPLFTAIYSFYVIPRLWLFPSVAYGDIVTRWWSSIALWLFNVSFDVEGSENVMHSGTIVVFNHTSFFDIPVMYGAIPMTMRFGAKAELFKIPFFGPSLRVVGILPIARGDREKVMDLYSKSIGRVKNGESMVLAPEGTRQDGRELGPFKSGPFVFAIEGQLPILPVVMYGNHLILGRKDSIPMWGRWSMKVKVKVLAPISTNGLTMDDRAALQERVRNLMSEAYAQLAQKN